MVLGNRLLLVFLVMFLVEGCIRKYNQNIDCGKVHEVSTYIGFEGFSIIELDEIRLVEICIESKDTLKVTIDSTYVDWVENNDSNKLIGIEKAYSNQEFLLKTCCKYELLLESFNHKKVQFKIKSLKKHYMNTMMSENSECIIGDYTINEKYNHNSKGFLIRKSELEE